MKKNRYLELKEIFKSFDGNKDVLKDINLEIEKGQFITFLGPSGSGKSTTLSLIAGFENLTKGDILINGKSIISTSPNRRNIGMVFQNYALFPHMTVMENVSYPLIIRRFDSNEIKKNVTEMLEVVDLLEHRHKYPEQLSGGQQQRVALARALVFKPELLLLDEPLSALDKNLRTQMQSEIKRLHNDFGITSIFVTHDQSEAMAMSDKVAVFNDGFIEQFDAPIELYRYPNSLFVAQFLGESNIFQINSYNKDKDLYYSSDLPNCKIALQKHQGSSEDNSYIMLRPEDIRINNNSETKEINSLKAVIDNIFDFGSELLVSTSVNKTEIKIKLPTEYRTMITVGDQVTLSWGSDQIHVI